MRIGSLQDDPYRERLATLVLALNFDDAFDFLTEPRDPLTYRYLATEVNVWNTIGIEIDLALRYCGSGYLGRCYLARFEELMWLLGEHELSNRLVAATDHGHAAFIQIKEMYERRNGKASVTYTPTFGGTRTCEGQALGNMREGSD